MKFLVLLLSILLIQSAFAQSKKQNNAKGTLPEVRMKDGSEAENEKTSMQAELLITKTETQAINSLTQLIKKYTGRPEEASLKFRLGELYMRRAKSGRFFDLYRNSGSQVMKFAPAEVKNENAKSFLRKAVLVYEEIENKFKNFDEMDAVHFNKAFAEQQLGLANASLESYRKLINNPKFEKSILMPDALLAAGEILYDMQKYDDALMLFDRMLNFPKSRIYSYGMYKAAWTLYNQQKTEIAIKKLVDVVKYHDEQIKQGNNQRQNLRKEALNDIVLFYADVYKADDAYDFLRKLADKEETGELLINMAKLYTSYSRFKEVVTFLKDLNKQDSANMYRPKAHILLAESYESLKQREDAIQELKVMSEICSIQSSWRGIHREKIIVNETCDIDLDTLNLQLTQKWWDLTQKNKGNKEIAQVTDKAFRLYLSREKKESPDIKTRFAFAEFLFQQGQFREASDNYEKVANLATDEKMLHEASYATIFALEKAREANDKKLNDPLKLLKLCEFYLAKNPKGQFVWQIRFKTALTYYEIEKYEDSEKWLIDLVETKNFHDFKEKSEDLLLDIYNLQKKYQKLSASADKILKKTTDANRKAKIQKILESSEYAQIQDVIKKGEKSSGAEKLIEFARSFKSAEYTKDSWLQALGIYFISDTEKLKGAELSLEFAELYPKDEKTIPSLQEAVKIYSENADLLKAAQVLEKLAVLDQKNKTQWIDIASEYYLMEGQTQLARKSLEFLYDSVEKSKQPEIMGRLLTLAKQSNDQTQLQALEKKIASTGMEPYTSELRLKKIEDELQKGKLTDVFNDSKKLVSSGPNASIRAKARILQAKVLEKELFNQSVKSKVDRLTLVLSLKTEKLDKAQQAYLDAIRISQQDPELQLEGLNGLARSYENYVTSIQNLQVTEELTDEDKKVLSSELEKLVRPIYEKLEDANEKIAKLTGKDSDSQFNRVSFDLLRDDETYMPQQITPEIQNFYAYLSVDLIKPQLRDRKVDCKKINLADLKENEDTVHLFKSCLNENKFNQTQEIGLYLTKTFQKSAMGPYLLALSSEKQKLNNKTLWMMELAEKRNKTSPILIYNRARNQYLIKNAEVEALNSFDKAIAQKLELPETNAILGLNAYAKSNFKEAIQFFDKIEIKDQFRLKTLTAYSESLAALGQKSKAVDIVKTATKESKDAFLFIQMARVYEKYEQDKTRASANYREASISTQDPSLKAWLDAKIAYLKK